MNEIDKQMEALCLEIKNKLAEHFGIKVFHTWTNLQIEGSDFSIWITAFFLSHTGKERNTFGYGKSTSEAYEYLVEEMTRELAETPPTYK